MYSKVQIIRLWIICLYLNIFSKTLLLTSSFLKVINFHIYISMKKNLLQVRQMVHKFGSQWWGGIRDILPVIQRNPKKKKENKSK